MFEKYIEHLIKWHEINRLQAETIVSDVKPALIWLMDKPDEAIFNYLSDIVSDSFTYSETLNLV